MSAFERFNVLAVNIKTDAARVLAKDKDGRNAEAIIKFAIMRRGLGEEFYPTATAGQYRDGDTWCEEARS